MSDADSEATHRATTAWKGDERLSRLASLHDTIDLSSAKFKLSGFIFGVKRPFQKSEGLSVSYTTRLGLDCMDSRS